MMLYDAGVVEQFQQSLMRFSESITIDVVSRIAHSTKCHLLTQNLGMTVIMAKTQRRKYCK